LDCPQVDEWLIKALGETFAPFEEPEKPQVFPTPATSFIKNGPDIGMMEAIGRRWLSSTAQVSERRRRYGYACFDWGFLRRTDAV
jgi:hypothetical protein